MSAIDDEQRLPGNDIKPSRPAYIPDSVPDILFGDLPALFYQRVNDRQHNRSVVKLMIPQQRQHQILALSAVKDLPLQRVPNQPQGFKIRLFQTDVFLRADPLKNRLHRGSTAVNHGMSILFEDPGLGFGNFFHGVAQVLRVIQTDVGDHRHLRRFNDIGGVQRAAHANLQNHNVAVFPAEKFKGNAGNQFKLRRGFLHGIRQGFYVFRHLRQLFIGDLHAVHLHPLMEAVDIGRGVEACPVTGFPQNGGSHRGGASLSVGSGNVDKFQFLLGVSHLFQQGLRPSQSGNAPLPADGMDICQCFFARHDIISKNWFSVVY